MKGRKIFCTIMMIVCFIGEIYFVLNEMLEFELLSIVWLLYFKIQFDIAGLREDTNGLSKPIE